MVVEKFKLKSLLDGVSKDIPSLIRAVKLQERAAVVGFDWENYRPVIDKLHEELGELEEAVGFGDRDHMEDELGDLLFVCTNLARKLEIDPEKAIKRANQKFERRFGFIESILAQRQIPLASAGPKLLNECWDEAKEQEIA